MIDWAFIASLEGVDILTGYVPNPEGSRSGVTIATGVDLGHLTTAELGDLPVDLGALVLPYQGRFGVPALLALREKPLTITEAQARALDGVAEAAVLTPLKWLYAMAVKGTGFDSLPDRAQTVLTSVAYQYGGALPARCPRFWGCMVRQDWRSAVSELRAFGDDYQPRHDKEAAYLAPLLASMPSSVPSFVSHQT